MNELPLKKEDAIAFFRFQLISEMLNAPSGLLTATATKIAKRQHNNVVKKKIITISRRTLFYYYANYKKYGFDGLKPKTRCDKGTHPKISKEIIKDILNLKKELPNRSAAKIVTMLAIARKIDDDVLNIRTVNRILTQYGYTKKSLSKSNKVYIKHEQEAACDMWQSDVMSAFYIPDGKNGNKLAYLIGIIDDHSRKIMHAEFYFDAKLPRLEDTLRKAIIKQGAPKRLYIDNGKIYISEQFKLISASFGIALSYSMPYKPMGKGKIEKYWLYVQNSFLSEVKNQKVKSLTELNDLYFAWQKVEYNDKIHSSIGVTPNERFRTSLKKGTKLRFFSPVELEEKFLHAIERTVTKYGVISFEGNTYEVPELLVEKKVIIRYNPFHINILYVYYNDKYFGIATPIDLKEERHKGVRSIPEVSGYDSNISKLYFENIKSNYQLYLEKQLKLKIDTNVVSTSIEQPCNEETNNHPIKSQYDPEYAISRVQFIELVKDAIGASGLTYQEKGKLNELWSTFKEFNEDILISILKDLSEKTIDFKKNFLYYIAQIRDLYLEKILQKGETKNA